MSALYDRNLDHAPPAGYLNIRSKIRTDRTKEVAIRSTGTGFRDNVHN
jgi:hypothetical protein